MKELIEYIARSLATNPDAVQVTESMEDGRVVFHLEVAPEDKGQSDRPAGPRGSSHASHVESCRSQRRQPRRAGHRIALPPVPLQPSNPSVLPCLYDL